MNDLLNQLNCCIIHTLLVFDKLGNQGSSKTNGRMFDLIVLYKIDENFDACPVSVL